MKIALLSDIHGNYFALKAVLEAVKKKNVNTLMIAGDFVGYYFWPKEVFEALESWDIVAVRGNHDRMLLEVSKDPEKLVLLSKKYGDGLKIALDLLDRNTFNWLTKLPDSIKYEVKNKRILLCHGSPWNEDEYVYPDSKTDSLLRYTSIDCNIVVQGHTHYPMCKKVNGIKIINPGSVGQPRNRELGAHWALLDTELEEVDFFCEFYNSSIVIKESIKRHPDIPYLANILKKI